MGRYEAGETLASIARTYDCSPPAISYIVSRSRERQPAADAPAAAAEPQLIKTPSTELVAALAAPAPVSTPAPEPPLAPAEPRFPLSPGFDRAGDRQVDRQGDHHGEHHGAMTATMTRPPARANGSGAPQPTPLPGGDARRTLRLSLGGNGSNTGGSGHAGNGHGNGGGAEPENQHAPGNGFRGPVNQPGERYHPAPQAQPPQPPMPPREQPRYNYQSGGGERPLNEAAETGRRKDTGTFIDQELRARVDGDIAAFLAAFDMALVGDTQESRTGLREATDRLLRAGARTRIELERLEARVPLAARDGEGRGEPNWRHR